MCYLHGPNTANGRLGTVARLSLEDKMKQYSNSCKAGKYVAALLGATALSLAMPAAHATPIACNLFPGKDQSCTDGSVVYENPSNLANVGSGIIDPFLTVHNSPTESGYSTDISSASQLPLDDQRNNSNTFTNTFTLANLGVVTKGNTQYYQFFLDANEPNSDRAQYLSLDTLKIYDSGSASPFLAGKNDTPNNLSELETYLQNHGGNKNPLYSLSKTINLDVNLFAGSGLGIDMDVLIPVSLFNGIDSNHRLVFASAFGNPDASEGGFEEWSYLKCESCSNRIPEPTSSMLLGLGLTFLGLIRRRPSRT